MKHITVLFWITILVISCLGLVGSQPVTADSLSPQNTIQVNIEADEYNTSGTGTGCSLREAIESANTDTARVLPAGEWYF
jgi:CSLREA domain-containing protein